MALADAIMNHEGLTSLNISANNIGELVLPEGWTSSRPGEYKSPAGECLRHAPDGSSPAGVIALANAIKNNRALTSLNLAGNHIEAEGAKHVAEAVEGHVSAPRGSIALELTLVISLPLPPPRGHCRV